MPRISSKYGKLKEYFSQAMPEARSELDFNNPYELIVAVVLSAQCTDKRVNLTTPALFARYPSVEDLAKAGVDEVYQLIKSISYPNNKAKHLVAMAHKVVSDFNSQIPATVEELQSLPGVGRKTANVVASIVYNEPVIAVDTHVFRVARRIGLSKGSTPLAVELDLEKGFDEEVRPTAHHWLILHGRYVCTARNPKCDECGISDICAHFRKSAK